jgi:hypothetical protein
MDVQKIKVGKRVSFTSRKTKGVGKVTGLKESETGVWVTIAGKRTHARATTRDLDWYATDTAAIEVTVRPSQVGSA